MPLARVNSQFEPLRLERSVAEKLTRTVVVAPSGRIAAERHDDRLVVDGRADLGAVDGHAVEPHRAEAGHDGVELERGRCRRRTGSRP